GSSGRAGSAGDDAGPERSPSATAPSDFPGSRSQGKRSSGVSGHGISWSWRGPSASASVRRGCAASVAQGTPPGDAASSDGSTPSGQKVALIRDPDVPVEQARERRLLVARGDHDDRESSGPVGPYRVDDRCGTGLEVEIEQAEAGLDRGRIRPDQGLDRVSATGGA